MNDNPKQWGSKDGQKMPFVPTQLFFSPLSLKNLVFLFCLCLSDPWGGWKWRIKTRAGENKPSCHQVSKHCSPPVTTLLDKSLFSLRNVSTWCYHFSLNSIKSSLSAQVKKNCIVLRWAHSFLASFPRGRLLQYDWECTAVRGHYEHKSLLNLCFYVHWRTTKKLNAE